MSNFLTLSLNVLFFYNYVPYPRIDDPISISLILQKLAASAEASAAVFDEYDDQAYAVPQADKRCDAYKRKMNESDVHFVSNSVEQNAKSGTHITVESYQCGTQ